MNKKIKIKSSFYNGELYISNEDILLCEVQEISEEIWDQFMKENQKMNNIVEKPEHVIYIEVKGKEKPFVMYYTKSDNLLFELTKKLLLE